MVLPGRRTSLAELAADGAGLGIHRLTQPVAEIVGERHRAGRIAVHHAILDERAPVEMVVLVLGGDAGGAADLGQVVVGVVGAVGGAVVKRVAGAGQTVARVVGVGHHGVVVGVGDALQVAGGVDLEFGHPAFGAGSLYVT